MAPRIIHHTGVQKNTPSPLRRRIGITIFLFIELAIFIAVILLTR